MNRLGQLKGDMPRYLDWNENARRIRGSRKYRPSSWSSESQGRSSGSSRRMGQRKTSRQPRKGLSKHCWKLASLARLSVRNARKEAASVGARARIACSICATSGVARSSATGAENQPILRVEANQFYLLPQVATHGLKNLSKHARIEKERRPAVEAEAVAPERGSPAAHAGRAFEDRDLETGFCQEHGRRQSARPRTNDDHALRHHYFLALAPLPGGDQSSRPADCQIVGKIVQNVYFNGSRRLPSVNRQ